jgi:putative ABC transport system permease protein
MSLAAIGLHGLIAHSVTERTVFAAAQTGVVLAAIRAVIGGAPSVQATRLVENSLYTISARDPMTYVGVAVLLFAIARVSSVLPTLMILRLDVASTFRKS